MSFGDFAQTKALVTLYLTPSHFKSALIKLKSLHKFNKSEKNCHFHTLIKSFKLKIQIQIQILLFKYLYPNEPQEIKLKTVG